MPEAVVTSLGKNGSWSGGVTGDTDSSARFPPTLLTLSALEFLQSRTGLRILVGF